MLPNRLGSCATDAREQNKKQNKKRYVIFFASCIRLIQRRKINAAKIHKWLLYR